MRLSSVPFVVILISLFFLSSPTIAQKSTLPVDTTITSTSEVTIKGVLVPYTVTVGTQPVWGDDGEAVASLLYTYYQRTDDNDPDTRPLLFSFNGGPGSASVWMHMGYTSPKQLNIDDEGYPIQPYGVHDNPHSILDVADIVYVNPVNTGFSRIIGDADREQFFGVNEDITYLAAWLENFVSRHGRWTSPKFLLGESYGTTRVSGLASALQGRQWMYLNGVILVSPTGLGVDRDGPVRAALRLPYFTAAAWYHKALPADLQQRDLDDLLPEVEDYTIEELIPTLVRGGSVDPSRRRAVAEQMSRYSGLSTESILDRNLDVPTSYFWKNLLHDQGLTIGRLDSRYRGVDRQNGGERYDYDPAMSAWNHAFAPAINHYLRDVLGFKTELKYNLFGPVSPWNRDGDETGENLRSAMAQNPYLHLMVQSGYYDGGTDYFNAKYTMWNLDPSGRLQDRMEFRGYRSGHMMYLRQEDLATSNQDIRNFIAKAVEAGKVPARY